MLHLLKDTHNFPWPLVQCCSPKLYQAVVVRKDHANLQPKSNKVAGGESLTIFAADCAQN